MTIASNQYQEFVNEFSQSQSNFSFVNPNNQVQKLLRNNGRKQEVDSESLSSIYTKGNKNETMVSRNMN